MEAFTSYMFTHVNMCSHGPLKRWHFINVCRSTQQYVISRGKSSTDRRTHWPTTWLSCAHVHCQAWATTLCRGQAHGSLGQQHMWPREITAWQSRCSVALHFCSNRPANTSLGWPSEYPAYTIWCSNVWASLFKVDLDLDPIHIGFGHPFGPLFQHYDWKKNEGKKSWCDKLN